MGVFSPGEREIFERIAAALEDIQSELKAEYADRREYAKESKKKLDRIEANFKEATRK